MQYEDYSHEDQQKLDEAWVKIEEGLDAYYEVTGAGFLGDAVNDVIWECVREAHSKPKTNT